MTASKFLADVPNCVILEEEAKLLDLVVTKEDVKLHPPALLLSQYTKFSFVSRRLFGNLPFERNQTFWAERVSNGLENRAQVYGHYKCTSGERAGISWQDEGGWVLHRGPKNAAKSYRQRVHRCV
ncbi:MAG: hypothetical protein Q9218_007052 [Villophora microphyllina]